MNTIYWIPKIFGIAEGIAMEISAKPHRKQHTATSARFPRANNLHCGQYLLSFSFDSAVAFPQISPLESSLLVWLVGTRSDPNQPTTTTKTTM
jgi:hypothetical protein